ncbi:MAG: D-alanyl-D-alanine carboxypeptidase, partial [Bdellovibrionales bacterium]|nr:D-alanyl-D-alanine carboxypeptidase [Bdellovibrionales bacterium]
MLVGKATVAAPSDTQILGELESAVRRFGKGAHLSVLDIRSRQKVFSYRDSDQVKPASVLKLLTSSVALRRLGAHHQFETYFFTDQSGVKNGKIEHLYVKGGGDPSLTIEDLWIVVRSLRRRGVRPIGSIWLDDTYFEHIKPAVGQRAYETGTSALSFNHNSIEFEVCPSINGAPAAISYNPLEMGV